MKAIDLKGTLFGRLTVIKKGVPDKRYEKVKTAWVCECSCGNTLNLTTERLRSGNTRSCGCLARERTILRNKHNTKHGMSKSREYKTWAGMKDRCFNTNNPKYLNYGGRGITVCKEWMGSFEVFYKDMGARPKGLTIDRINNEGDYEASNCRWATYKEQNNNKRNSKRSG